MSTAATSEGVDAPVAARSAVSSRGAVTGRKHAVELIATFFLVVTIGATAFGSGTSAPLAVGAALMVMVPVAIVGACRASQLAGTAPAADSTLSEAELHEIDAILADAEPVWGAHPEGM